MNSQRFAAALNAFLWHLLASAGVAALIAVSVFTLLYPEPFAAMLGGVTLLVLVMAVDVVCGPLLTFVLYNPAKTKFELTLDLGLVVCLQAAALMYGLYTVWVARPVYLVHEIDRFRVITMAEMASESIRLIPAQVGGPAWFGPKPVGVQVAKGTDQDYLSQLERSMAGQEVAFRTERWLPYGQVVDQVLLRAHPIAVLESRYPESSELIAKALQATGRTREQLKFVPVTSRRGSGWTALIDASTAEVVGWVQLDGF